MNEMVPIRPEISSLDQKIPDEKNMKSKEMAPVVKHPGKIRKPSFTQKAANVFLAEDLKVVKDHFINYILVPGIKEAFMSTLEMLLFGEGRYRGGRRNASRTNERVSYDTYYDSSRYDRCDRRDYSSSRSKSRIDNIELDFYEDADEAVIAIQKRIRRDGYAYTANLFQACKMSFDHTDYNEGWERGQEQDFDVRRLRNGHWTIKTPETRNLNK